MSNVISLLNVHIRKLARRETKSLFAEVKKRTAEHRRSIAALKREIAALRKAFSEGARRGKSSPAIPQGEVKNARLRIDGLKAHRLRLGLSAADYGKLLGVSPLTIYHWEQKKSKPRRSLLPRIVAVRGIGKREALSRLEALSSEPRK